MVDEEEGGAAGAQVSESTTAPGGSCTEEMGAPAAIGKVAAWPVTSFTVSVQVLAEAIGEESASQLASDVPASVIAMISLRLINNSARLLLLTPCASSPPSRTLRTLLTASEHCNAEPFPVGASWSPVWGPVRARFTRNWVL